MTSLSTDAFSKRMQVLGFRPSEYMPIVRLIDTWSTKTGEEWTVARLKDLRQLYIHWYLNIPYELTTRIEVTRGGVPKGPFHALFSRKKSSFRRIWNALLSYTGFVAAKLTNKQWAKFIGGVERPPLSESARVRTETFLELGLQWFLQNCMKPPFPPAPEGEPIERYPFRPGKRKVIYPPQSVSEENAFWPSISHAVTYQQGFLRRFPHISDGVLSRFGFIAEGPTSNTALIGRLSVIQEPGYKARIVANPSIVYQQCLRPLMRWLEVVCRTLPGNFQYDQNAGKLRVKEMLEKGFPAVSIDSSGWTDHFPRAYVLYVMEKLGVDKEWLDCYDLTCGGTWRVPEDAMPLASNRAAQFPDGKPAPKGGAPRYTTAWRVGQPLGLLPTFNGASLAHVMLALGIQVRCSETAIDEPLFVIVGDDIVWFDLECAEVYMAILDDSGVPVSHDKTLVSDRAAEFCSTIITALHGVVPSLKWKQASDDSFVDLCRNLGVRSRLLLPLRQRKVVDVIAPFPEPFGLGWNPLGISYWERMRLLQESGVIKSSVTKLKSLDLRGLHVWYNSARLDHSEYAKRNSYPPSPEQGDSQVLSDIFGFAVSPVLAISLGEHIANLSAQGADELMLYGSLSSETLAAFPKAVAGRLSGVPSSAVAAELALLLSRIKRHLRVSDEITPVATSKLEQLEGLLLRTSLRLKSLEIKAMRKR